MKRFFSFLFFCLLIFFSVFAEKVYINELGQQVSHVSEYQRETIDDKTFIYKEDSIYCIISNMYNYESKTLTTKKEYPQLEKTVTEVYVDTLPFIKKTEFNDGTSETVTFAFIENELAFVSYKDRDNKTEIEYYLRNAHDNSLMAVKRLKETDLIGDNYVFSEENILNTNNGIIATGKIDTIENGEFSFIREGVQYTYDSESRLIKKEDSSEITVYYYKDGFLVKNITRTKTFPEIITEIEYEDSNIKSEIKTSNGLTIEKTVFPKDSGKIKTIYSDGEEYANIYYMSDNKRVIKVEYINRNV